MSAGLLKLEKPYISDESEVDPIEANEEESDISEDELELMVKALDEDQIIKGGGNGETDSVELGQILDVLLPPYQSYDSKNHLWITKASRTPPTRGSVIQLWEQLDIKLLERQARPSGICTVRSELFQECFDELIRQVTIDCAERGLLLARVRDEALMTLTAFQALFESASEFGASKAVQAETGASEAEAELNELVEDVEALEAEVRRLEAWKRQTVRRAAERRTVQATLFSQELEALKRSEKQYQLLIETLLSSRNTAQS
ncbi:Axonemal dynein light chain [Trinorchestia longiramus]|nr:Axonemal dynein light chain [Trinorchestia longiramus]